RLSHVRFDTLGQLRHSRIVPLLGKRLGAIGCLLALLGALWTPCGGWQVSAEARLSCCTSDGSCPMEAGSDASAATSHTGMTQADADRCCAAAEGSRSSPASTSPFSGVLALAVIDGPLSAIPPVLTHVHSFPSTVDV